MRQKSILLFGAPGSGKGTQGQILGSQPGFVHFACGDVFRSLDPNSPMGKVFANYGRTGGLVPDQVTVELWRQTLQERIAAGKINPQTDIVILDGIPRTLEQAQLMDPMIEVLAIIYLACNDVAEIISRLRGRAAESARPDDTSEEVIRHRLDVYEEQTRPVLEFYPRGKIIRVDATRPREEVAADIARHVAPMKADRR